MINFLFWAGKKGCYGHCTGLIYSIHLPRYFRMFSADRLITVLTWGKNIRLLSKVFRWWIGLTLRKWWSPEQLRRSRKAASKTKEKGGNTLIDHTDPFLVWMQGKNNDNNNNNNDNNSSNDNKTTFVLPLKSTKTAKWVKWLQLQIVSSELLFEWSTWQPSSENPSGLKTKEYYNIRNNNNDFSFSEGTVTNPAIWLVICYSVNNI